MPDLSLINSIRPTTGRIREDKEFSHLTKEEFPGASDIHRPSGKQDVSIRCAELLLGDSRTILKNTATFITVLTPATDFCEGIFFGQCHTVSRGRNLSTLRGRHLVTADHEPWSPAAWFIGGVNHFPTEVPVDCIYLGYPWQCPSRGKSRACSCLRCIIVVTRKSVAEY